MVNPTVPTQNEVINSWHVRARAYDKLTKRWPIFTDMVSRLLEIIPEGFDGHALDIAGGSGLLAEHLIRKNPNARVTIVEPAEGMRALASQHLGDQVEVKDATSDNLNKLKLTADAALCSASFHLMNEKTTLPSVASVLKKGSVFAVNCWGHSYDETIDLEQKVDWMQFVNQALSEFNLPPMIRSDKNPTRIKSKEGLRKIGKSCGLHLCETKIVTTQIKTQFSINFAAMSLNFLDQVEKDIREQIIARALEVCDSIDTIFTVEFKFEKV